jgi:FtsH-binding integral membrane protein
VPLSFAAFLCIAYWIGLRNGVLPFRGVGEWLWLLTFAACLIWGSVRIFNLNRQKSISAVIALVAIYALLMALVLAFVAFRTACAFGDCL